MKILSITTVRFDEYFGFTDAEVREMLKYYGLANAYDSVKSWYDGYRFGNVDVYCPWDVINYCDELRDDPSMDPKDYWSNTSGNDIVKRFLAKAGAEVAKKEIEALIAGETVTKEIHEELTYNNLYDSIDNIWSVLFTTGYLTQRGKPDGKRFELAIPNMEIRNIFTEQIMELFKADAKKDGETLQAFCEALKTGDAGEVERLFNDYLDKSISIRDTFVRKPTKENLPSGKATAKGLKEPNPSVCFYHGILLGILGFKGDWYVKSNKESGDGYRDILIEIEREKIGIIIEVKYAENGGFDASCRAAVEQIEREKYTKLLKEHEMDTILKYGIACHKKTCKVILEL